MYMHVWIKTGDNGEENKNGDSRITISDFPFKIFLCQDFSSFSSSSSYNNYENNVSMCGLLHTLPSNFLPRLDPVGFRDGGSDA